jgi:scyllo-inositol 2-dehydrogenase (NADP+)
MAVARGRSQEAPVRLAIVGLVHDHVRPFIPSLEGRRDIQLVGIVEPNKELVAYIEEHDHLGAALFFPSLEALVAKTKVDAVATFTSTFDHRRVVELCAPLGIDVMMEKPLAASYADARAIAAAAEKGGIQVVVNYETTWYPATAAAFALVRASAIGDVRKIVVHDGHEGPKAIGCSPYFLNWLTDPVLNGGGAGMDFGCYGADLVTDLMGGRRPTSVVAVAQHFQPDAYPRVEDEETIVLTYPRAQAILEASWNWPYNRKDMEIYGQTGTVLVPSRASVLLQKGREPQGAQPAPALTSPYADPVSYLVAVVRGKIRPSGLSSLEVNLVVSEILGAAEESARTGRRIDLEGASPR